MFAVTWIILPSLLCRQKDMFGSGMKFRVLRQCDGTLAVDLYVGGFGK